MAGSSRITPPFSLLPAPTSWTNHCTSPSGVRHSPRLALNPALFSAELGHGLRVLPTQPSRVSPGLKGQPPELAVALKTPRPQGGFEQVPPSSPPSPPALAAAPSTASWLLAGAPTFAQECPSSAVRQLQRQSHKNRVLSDGLGLLASRPRPGLLGRKPRDLGAPPPPGWLAWGPAPAPASLLPQEPAGRLRSGFLTLFGRPGGELTLRRPAAQAVATNPPTHPAWPPGRSRDTL